MDTELRQQIIKAIANGDVKELEKLKPRLEANSWIDKMLAKYGNNIPPHAWIEETED